MWILSAAPWCRSASSSLCRQVAVMLVADVDKCWHREAENEKFPSPTNKMVRGGDMCRTNEWQGTEKLTFQRDCHEICLSLHLEVPEEEARVGATVITISPLPDLRNYFDNFRCKISFCLILDRWNM